MQFTDCQTKLANLHTAHGSRGMSRLGDGTRLYRDGRISSIQLLDDEWVPLNGYSVKWPFIGLRAAN